VVIQIAVQVYTGGYSQIMLFVWREKISHLSYLWCSHEFDVLETSFT